MWNSLFDVVKMCLPKKQVIRSHNNTECKLEDLDNEETTLKNNKGNKTFNNEITTHSVNKVKKISFKGKCTTFGVEEDETPSSPVHSPKFINIESDAEMTVANSHQNTFQMATPSQSGTEDSNRFFIKEKLSDMKERNKTLLFTIKDPELDNQTERVFCMNNIVILDSEICQAKRLVVEDYEGKLLFGNILVIDASGYVNSLRKRRDGHVFFGPVAEYKDCVINDFIVNFSKDSCKTRLFVIFYERYEQKYYIRNLNDSGENNTMYIRVQKPMQIKKKLFFSLNQVVILVDPYSLRTGSSTYKKTVTSQSNSLNTNTEEEIVVYVYNNGKGDNENSVFRFKPQDSPVLIGRSKCSITINSSSLSKRHCCLSFNKEERLWEIIDGYANKPSLNGTWMVLNSKYEINEKTFVKVGDNVLKITLA